VITINKNVTLTSVLLVREILSISSISSSSSSKSLCVSAPGKGGNFGISKKKK
jgi:hypothetical protein